MKTNEIFLIIGIVEVLIAILFTILIIKTNKKLKQLECKHKNVFHFISSEKDEKTCMNCGKHLKDKNEIQQNLNIMKNLSIYDTYVVMENQEQCDRMKQFCIDNNLPYWKWIFAFKLKKTSYFMFSSSDENGIIGYFAVYQNNLNKTKVTEKEFINLLNNK